MNKGERILFWLLAGVFCLTVWGLVITTIWEKWG